VDSKMFRDEDFYENCATEFVDKIISSYKYIVEVFKRAQNENTKSIATSSLS